MDIDFTSNPDHSLGIELELHRINNEDLVTALRTKAAQGLAGAGPASAEAERGPFDNVRRVKPGNGALDEGLGSQG